MSDDLQADFAEAMLDIYREAREELDYTASRFHQLVQDQGGVGAARTLLHADTVSDGYRKLWEHDRLDLSVEALVLQPKWSELFSEAERSIARSRLNEYGVDVTLPSVGGGEASGARSSPSNVLQADERYTRPELYELLDVPEEKRGGDWETGYHRDDDDRWYIFASVGGPSRTGHDYSNRWDGNRLVWRGRSGSKLRHPSIQRMLEDDTEVHVFTRASDRDPFTYEGRARAAESEDTEPVTIVWQFPQARDDVGDRTPGEIDPKGGYREGSVQRVSVNIYERNRLARRQCLKKRGHACSVCGMEFGERYGELVEGYIHVHHLVPLSELGEDYEVDPIEDLRPVCPNCHAVIHKCYPPLTIEDARLLLEDPGNH